MCSIEEDIEELNLSSCSHDTLTHYKKSSSKLCRKCGDSAVVLLQKKDAMCKLCFNAYFYHKFKSIIGKSKLIRPGCKVLIACSGGSCSSALLSMVKQALDDAAHKKLMFTPGVLHIDESFLTSDIDDDVSKISSEVINLMNASGYPTVYSSLEMAFRSDTTSFYADDPTKYENFSSLTLRAQFYESLQKIKSLTSKQEYIECLRLQLIKDIAKDAGYTHVFVGDSATNLAVKLLCNAAMGKGSQISPNTAFCDQRSDIAICRPMREFLKTEISRYNKLNDISYVVGKSLLTMTDFNGSIQRLTEKFVCGLQEDFPATIFTIFRTSGKLSATGNCSNEKCIICDSHRDNVCPEACSALEALSLSAKLSNMEQNLLAKEKISPEFESSKNLLCHGCSIILDEMKDKADLPYSFTRKLSPINTRLQMRGQIEDFILKPDAP